MAHVERVSVEGFKKIAELSVEPGQFTVVTGRNNSGKTSLLEAVRIGCEPKTVREFRLELTPISRERGLESTISSQIRRGRSQAIVRTTVDEESENVELRQPSDSRAREVVVDTMVELLERKFEGEGTLAENFERDSAEGTAQHDRLSGGFRAALDTFVSTSSAEFSKHVTLVISDGTEYPAIDNVEVINRVLFSFVASEVVNRLDESGLQKLGVQHSDSETSALTFTSNLTRRLDTFQDAVPKSRLSTRLVTHGTTIDAEGDAPVRVDNVGDFLRDKEILDDLKTFTLDNLIFDPEDGEKYSVPFEQMGEGFQAIVAFLWELLDDDLPEVLFLEEPTTHMHPGYIREVVYFLIQLAMEENVQLFVTTHSNDFLNDLFTENLRDEEVAFLEEEFKLFQMQDGGAKTLDYREAEHSLEELMLDLRGL